MFKNRVQIGRLGGVDGLVGNAGNLVSCRRYLYVTITALRPPSLART